jgi:hypothetical protein
MKYRQINTLRLTIGVKLHSPPNLSTISRHGSLRDIGNQELADLSGEVLISLSDLQEYPVGGTI